MEIIKRINARKAWVRIDDTKAVLLEFDKDKTNAEMIAKGKEIHDKRERLAEVRTLLKEGKK